MLVLPLTRLRQLQHAWSRATDGSYRSRDGNHAAGTWRPARTHLNTPPRGAIVSPIVGPADSYHRAGPASTSTGRGRRFT